MSNFNRGDKSKKTTNKSRIIHDDVNLKLFAMKNICFGSKKQTIGIHIETTNKVRGLITILNLLGAPKVGKVSLSALGGKVFQTIE